VKPKGKIFKAFLPFMSGINMWKDTEAFKKLLLFSALFVLLLQLSMMQFGAQSVAGTSKFMAVNETVIYQNSSTSVNFSVNLLSGTAGTTYLVLADGQALAQKGINVGFAPSLGTPPFNGVIYINTNINPQIVFPGTYQLEIESSGADPIFPGMFNITLTVVNSAKPSTTISTTIPTTQQSTSIMPTTQQSTSIMPTTAQSTIPYATGSGTNAIYAAIIIIAIIVVVAAAVYTKTRK